MKWNKKFNYPRSTRSYEDGVRKYLYENEKFPSVTSILSATKSDEDRAALELWRQRVGKLEANKIKSDASRRGTALHSYLEDYCRGRINDTFFESNEQYKNMAKIIIENGIKGKLEEIYGMEVALINHQDKYAGTADLVGIYSGNETIIDFKQSNKPKKAEFISDYFLQLGAYCLAHDYSHQTNIKVGIILLCTVDNLFQKFIIQGTELEMYKNLFLGRLKKFYELKNIS
tara:strand:- start:809 stop:1498 length:690 start_codon:yes stop_codon:yes gene_type:complete